MLDLGWAELAFVLVLALIVVGPKDLPKLARFVGQAVSRLQRFYRESMFNLRRLENEIEVASRPGDQPAYLDLLPEHVKQAMASEQHGTQTSTVQVGTQADRQTEQTDRRNGPASIPAAPAPRT